MGSGMTDPFAITEDLPLTTAQQAQDARMEKVPALYRTTLERLAVELALAMDTPEETFQRYNYTPEAAAELLDTPSFTVLLSRIGKEVRESGLSFRSKAKAISEELLPHAFSMATDPEVSSAVRADLIKWAAKVAGNEPKEAKDDGRSSGGLNLSITFANQPPMKVVSQESNIIEQI